VVPDACIVAVNYRYAPDKTADAALAHVHDVLDAALPDGTAAEVVDQADACRPGLDDPAARELVDAVAATGVGAPRAKLGWTDVARFGALGIPAVNYGPGDPELAHADDERVSIAEIETVRKGLESWLAR
jgi:succinyl-diaminopimelate desuccinylase